ncbi:hypothetical protein BGX38DRAFT_1270139 [Terfezia claveryi]|nr:hypothetical protein BGX38DRAFT_1270139 [Terfezia claveryi]
MAAERPKPVTLKFSTVGIEVIENRTWSFCVPFDAVSSLKKLCEQIGLCRDFIQDFDYVPSLVKTKFYIRDSASSAYIVSGNWEGLATAGGTYEIILKPNREDMLPPGVKGSIGADMMGHGEVEGPPGYGGGGGKMSGGGPSYYKDMQYPGKEMSYPGRPKY